jgi:hypothetical protein
MYNLVNFTGLSAFTSMMIGSPFWGLKVVFWELPFRVNEVIRGLSAKA